MSVKTMKALTMGKYYSQKSKPLYITPERASEMFDELLAQARIRAKFISDNGREPTIEEDNTMYWAFKRRVK